MSRRLSLAIAAAFAFAALPAMAGTPINQTRALDATGEVHVENIKGRIVVRTWARQEVRITGTLGKGAEKLEVEGDANSLDIAVKYPNARGGWNFWGRSDNGAEPTVLEVTIPQRASLEVESVAADVDVQQMAGARLSVSSVSGQVSVTASSPGEAELQNVSGDILAKITTPRAQVESVSGDVRLQGGLDGEVSMESVSGNLELTARALSQLKLSSVSGDATVRTALKPGANVEAETLSGTLALNLPRATGGRLHVETFSGDIDSPAGTVQREEHGPGKSLEARLGDGRGEIKLESFSGDVRIVLE
jgi:DUF4097 and DUF4098 domain-containing protein YvlB